ncbi:MAG TPA: SNF2-related protein [Bacillota bacterium]|nr:SNF2-related protein [Bacillota bacterium]HPT60999.1 SNF2-related protein [Bacillota bacterium]
MENQLELRPYQLEGIKVLTSSGRHLLADTMGLGKTVTVLKSIDELDAYPALIVATKNALGVWESEISKWLGKQVVIYSGPPHQRVKAWEDFVTHRIPFVITNYAFVEEITRRKLQWPTIVADEIHLAGLLNRKTVTFKRFKQLKSRYLFLVTGSPIRRNPADLWASFHLLDPKRFNSYWQYVNKYCVTIKTPFGTEIESRPKDVKEFRQMAHQYMLRRTKEQVAADLPPKIRSAIPLEMTAKQRKLYTQLAEELIAESDGEFIIASNQLSAITKLRQLLVSPLLLNVNDKGAALEALPELVESEFSEGNSIAIFTPYRAAVNLIADELSKLPKDIRPDFIGKILGTLSYSEIADAARRFQAAKTYKKVMVCTIKSSTSFTIHDASAAYFVGYEWDFNQNEQAEDRLHRIGQKKTVRCYYIMHKDSLDDRVMEVISTKKAGANIMLKPEHLLPERYQKLFKIDR